MIFPFIIGVNSNNEPQCIDLATVPLLMVSYTDSHELLPYFLQFQVSPFSGGSITAETAQSHYFIGHSRFGFANASVESSFYTDEPEKGSHISRARLLQTVLREMQFRARVMKQKKMDSFERYHSLNLWNTIKLPYRLLLIDDIWNLVKAKPDSLSISLFRILLNGPTVGIHTIMGSNISYRNLLQHLISLNPPIRKMLQEKYGIPEPTQISAIAQELILTPDKLVFYKKAGEGSLEKFYPLK